MESKESKEIKIYEVGGSVRDRLLGLKHNDIDYAVECSSFNEMKEYVSKELGMKIVSEKPEYGTLKAFDKNINKPSEEGSRYLKNINKSVDFSICRKDGTYTDGRRPDSIIPTDILTDLSRRDFTINAIAIHISYLQEQEEEEDKEATKYIDPFGGIDDIKLRIIRCVGDTKVRLMEDPLRLLRALRFSVTKDMKLDKEFYNVLEDSEFIKRLTTCNLSIERKIEELKKMFTDDTLKSLQLFSTLPIPIQSILLKDIKLIPTKIL